MNDLKEFVIKQSAVTDEEITSATSLADDLGISGDDAVEFIVAFGKAFNVDISQFRISDYFKPEGGLMLINIFTSTKKPFTVGHLEKAILTGKLES